MPDPYPVRVDARLEPGLSRWRWLVKWLLAIPHNVVLIFLWVAFAVLTVVAFFAILFTGRYPRSIFDFNVGVMRWSWRVSYYTYGALGTDRYPPFSLAEVPDYPAHLEIEYPERLSRGLVLVKTWLLAIPHYLVLAFFAGGGLYVVTGADADRSWTWGGGLIALLVLIAGVVLLFTGRYPKPVFDLVLGMDRWALRVAAYAALMTDQYPPFRLDLGGNEPPATTPSGSEPEPVSPAPPTEPAPATAAPQRPSGWTAGRIVALIAGTVAILIALGSGLAGGALAFVDTSMRDDDDFLMSGTEELQTTTYAVSTENVQLHGDGGAASLPQALLGEVKITAEADSGSPVFLGIGESDEVADYLDGVAHSVLVDLEDSSGDLVPEYRDVGGGAPGTPPGEAGVWEAQMSGVGEQTLVWEVEDGDWTVVLMNADASPVIDADVSAGATVPVLGWGIAVLLIVAALFLALGVLLLVLAVRRAHVPTAPVPPPVPVG